MAWHSVLYSTVSLWKGDDNKTSGFYSRHYQIFWEVVGLERGPLSIMSTIEELLEKKIATSVYKAEIIA
jgi:hypothetical protein